MSSRELLVLLRELPEVSRFKEASERTFRVVEYQGENDGDKGLVKGAIYRLPAMGWPPSDVEVIAEYVDWTYDRKLLARNTREVANARADGHDYSPDMTGLIEPLDAIVAAHQNSKRASIVAKGRAHIFAGLHAHRKGG